MPDTNRVLVVCGSPERSSERTIRRAACLCSHVVTVDRGFDAAAAAGVPIDLFCGDADTVSESGRNAVMSDSRPFEVERYDPHKDATDLDLALRAVDARWPRCSVIVTCCSGGAPDHALGVLGRLAASPHEVLIIEDSFEARVLHACEVWTIQGAEGRRFSCIPLSEDVVVSEYGMRWGLDHARVPLLSDLGISNVVEDKDASVACHSGVLVAWLFR